MLAYMCKNCKQFTVLGMVNEYDEHFCDEECYKEYCERHGYGIHMDKLIQIDERWD